MQPFAPQFLGRTAIVRRRNAVQAAPEPPPCCSPQSADKPMVKMKQRSPANVRELVRGARWLIVASAVMALVGGLGWLTGTPVWSIFPYGVAVGVAVWHGMTVGFTFGALATIAALATGAFPRNENPRGHETGEGLFTYLKLSAVVLGVRLGKRLRR